jgi:hypothetical protein
VSSTGDLAGHVAPQKAASRRHTPNRIHAALKRRRYIQISQTEKNAGWKPALLTVVVLVAVFFGVEEFGEAGVFLEEGEVLVIAGLEAILRL